MSTDGLEDQCHAIMLERFKKDLDFYEKPRTDDEIFISRVEEPFQHFAFRGVVDIVTLYYVPKDWYPAKPLYMELFEIKPSIRNVNDTIRTLRLYGEYFEIDFKNREGIEFDSGCNIYLVLLKTEENLRLISEYSSTFKGLIDSGRGLKEYRILLYDPLAKKPEIKKWRDMKEGVLWGETMKLQKIIEYESSPDDMLINVKFKEKHNKARLIDGNEIITYELLPPLVKPPYKNAKHFIEIYKKIYL